MIKNLLNPGNYPKNINIVLLLIRMAVGVFMITHGDDKFLKLFGEEPIRFADPLGVGVT
ncbi:MAG: hypothetical protein KF852_14955 [Saprospiraceae bacterium]|nr:hypothetical protein [Saprospiraceae bacterium]